MNETAAESIVNTARNGMVACFHAGQAHERARHGWWWWRRRRREHAEQLNMSAWERLGDIQRLVGDIPAD